VTIITAHNKRGRTEANIEGIQVIYLPIFYDNKLSFSKRVNAFFHFVFYACIESIKAKNVDICYVMTTPLTTGFIALFNRFCLGRPYIFEVGDLWPLVPIDMGILRNKLMGKFWFWWERVFYQSARGIVALSPPIATYIQNIVPDKPIATIPNIADCAYFGATVPDLDLRNRLNPEGHFLISYIGTFGLANDLLRFPEFALNLQNVPVKFLFVGDGAEKSVYQEKVEELRLPNVSILDYVPKEEVKKLLSISDAVLISFADFDSLHTGSPNKLFDALSAGRLITINFGGWVAELIKKEQCGFSFDPNSSKDFMTKISPFLSNSDLLKKYQQNARKLAENQFDLKILAEKQAEFIKSILG